MRYRFLRYPGGKFKAVTLSYDDGVRADVRLAEICNRYGLKCTFNINSAWMGANWGRAKLSVEEIQKYILDAGHEVAVHGHQHKAPGLCRPVEAIQDVLECRMKLEKAFGRIVRGMAYPDSGIRRYHNGAEYPQIRQNLIDLDIAYSRTLGADNNDFQLPQDWYAWMPTCHHKNPLALDYAREFVAVNLENMYGTNLYPRLFYLWGHSYEFDNDNNWELLEALAQTLGGKEDIWYATNMEIYSYVKAYESLVFSADGGIVYNPTLVKIWFNLDGKDYTVAPGETLVIEE